MGTGRPRPLGMEPQLHPSSTVVRARVPLLAGEGETEVMDGELRYDTADPYAVTLEVTDGPRRVSWTFARELLTEGRYDPAGDGDVHVWPCLSVEAASVTIIELHGATGDVLLQAPTRAVDRFLTDAFAAVPAGQESDHLALDALVARLLG